MTESNVVRLAEFAPGYAMEDVHALCQWLRNWADHLESPGSWMPSSLVVVIEADTGGLAVISQATSTMDMARVVGLLQLAAMRRANGEATIEGLTP